MATAKLGYNCHGKAVCRVVKVVREGPKHTLRSIIASVALEGNNDDVFKKGDNSGVIPTDTCKNTIYYLAHQNNFNTIEEFSLIVCRHFLSEYPSIVTGVKVDVEEELWERVLTADSRGRPNQEHNHSFVKPHLFVPFVHATAHRGRGSGRSHGFNYTMTAGIKDLTIAKTTQSSFLGFHQDRFTSLPSEGDRIMSTTIYAAWTFSGHLLDSDRVSRFDFAQVMDSALSIFLDTFSGPADTGAMSDSVQATLYSMGEQLIQRVPEVDNVRIVLPNNHNFPYPLQEKVGIPNKDHEGKTLIFFPTADPFGRIEATVERQRSRL